MPSAEIIEGGFRLPPANFEAEQALLAAIMVNNNAMDGAADIVTAGDFLEPVHGRIFEACATLINRGQMASPVTLKSFFESDSALEEVGGAEYLAKLAASAVTIINAADYAREIRQCSIRRNLIGIGERMVNAAFDSNLDADAESQIEAAESELYETATGSREVTGFRPWARVATEAVLTAEAAYKRDGGMAGIATGLRELDTMMGGLHDSDLVVLAGRPSMGKTALATNIAVHAAKAHLASDGGGIVGFFSLEMSGQQLATRVLAHEADLSSQKLRQGDLTDAEFLRFATGNIALQNLPLFIDDTAALSVGALGTRARRQQRQHGLGLVVVDYLQLVAPPARRGRNDNRVQEISYISQALKALAKDLGVPVLALSQLSRAPEKRDDKRPLLSDLRESGAIEQDADVVIFVYREEYYLERTQPAETDTADHDAWRVKMGNAHAKAELIIAKQRHGPTGTANAYFHGPTTSFSNAAPGSPPPPPPPPRPGQDDLDFI